MNVLYLMPSSYFNMCFRKQKYTIYLAHTSKVVAFMASYLQYLTDLSVQWFTEWDPVGFQRQLLDKQV